MKVLALIALVAVVCALSRPPSFASAVESTYPAKWVDMVLDHFDATNFETFKNRYYINDDYYVPSKGVVFLAFGEESPLTAPPSGQDEVAVLAKEHGALIVALEHRYYGETQPRPNWSTANMKYLSPEQALEDLAQFVRFIDEKYHGAGFNGEPRDKWVAFGGSYSGAMSAWMRIKYPHLVHAALSSSGVVNALNEFTAFDIQIQATARDYSQTCLDAMIATTAAIERDVAKDTPKALAKFSAAYNMGMFDFFYFIADAMSLPHQYGHSDALCAPLVAAYAKHTDDALINALADYNRDWFTKKMNPMGARYYDANYLKGSRIETQASQRQWWWEKCSSLAYFQVAPKGTSIRSKKFVTLDGHHDYCKRVFGIPVQPHTERTNDHFGGPTPFGHRVFYANGGADPWRHAAVQKTLGPDQPAETANCVGCAHCCDLHSPSPNDPPQLTTLRKHIAEYMRKWIAMPKDVTV